MASYIFGGSTGMTPEQVRRERQIANLLLGKTQAPKNWGEGLNAIAGGLVSRWREDAANEGEQAGMATAASTRDRLFSLLGGGGASAGGGGNAPATSSAPVNMDGNEVYTGFMNAVREGGVTNPYALAAIAATGKHESSFRPDLATSTWSDPSESGQPGTSGGIMSWRGPRYDALTQFGGGDLSPATQAKFFLQENPDLIAALNNAQSAEEAVSLMNNAWRFAGYNRPGGEAAARLATAQGFLPMFQQGPDVNAYTQVASLDPTVGLDALNAQNPATGLFDPGLAMGQPAPAKAGNLPPQAPQQVAQADAPSGQPFPQRQAPGADIPLDLLMEAISSPWLDDGTKALAGQLLSQRFAPPPGPITVGDVLVDPNTGQPIYDARNPSVTNVDGTVIDNRTGQPIYQAPQQRPYEVIDGEVVFLDQQTGTAQSAGQFGNNMTDAQRNLEWRAREAGLEPGTPEYQHFMATGGSQPLVNVNLPDPNASTFFQSLGDAEVKNYSTMLEQGPVAARTINQIDQLETLLANTPQGLGAAATQFAGNFGIDLGGASGVQAAQALINQMVPAQRPPGSGPMSDADLKLFKQSVPRLINQPGGNELIIQTMRDMAQYDLALSRIIQEHTWIAETASTPEQQVAIRRQMRDQIDALQNPLESFSDRISGFQRQGAGQTGGGQSQANPAILPPRSGEVVDGYRFKGGDPADPNSWEPVQ